MDRINPDEIDEADDFYQNESLDDSKCIVIGKKTNDFLQNLIKEALERIELLKSDSKLAEFENIISAINPDSINNSKICVLTRYIATQYYLADAIEELSRQPHVFNGNLDISSKKEMLAYFANTGGILVSSLAMMREGLSLSEVSDLILYDLPYNKTGINVVLGRFCRFGREIPLKIHALTPSDDGKSMSENNFKMLEEVIASGL